MDRLRIEIPKDYGSREAASFCAQLDDQLALLKKDLKGVTTDELQWQPGAGMNTIGMLLAHMAIVEVFWTQVGLQGKPPEDSGPVLGIGMDDDGMPAKADTTHPETLAGKNLSFYEDLLDRGRACVKQTARTFSESDMDATRERKRRDGHEQELNVRWVFYHLIEHFAGHYGQILLLRHQYRDAHARTP